MEMGWKKRTAMAVVVPEIFLAPPAALGAVYCATQFAPHQLNWLEKVVSKHIVMPHLERFEKLGGSIRHAHEEYDRKKREMLIASGQPVPDKSTPVLSRQERADAIAETLTLGAIAMTADLAVTGMGHHILSKRLNVDVSPRIAFAETGVHLGGIAMMAGPLAYHSENMHHWIKRKLVARGVNDQRADDLGFVIPYIVLPGQVAALSSLSLALACGGRCR